MGLFPLFVNDSRGVLEGSVVDPNRLYSDLDPASNIHHVHSDPDPAMEPNGIRIRLEPDQDPT